MKKICFALLAAAMSVSAANAAKVSYFSNTVTYNNEEGTDQIEIVFKKCMANKLFTFESVKLNKILVNQTSSDNIGPFLVNGYWMGGNHLNSSQQTTATTLSYSVTLDGKTVSPNRVANGSVLVIEVNNELFYADGAKFCDEHMTYRVSGNSIEVMAEHTFQHQQAMTVSRYYGAQSMFPATELLLPGTQESGWISLPGKSEIDVISTKYPNFSTFVERSANGYQAVLKYRDGMGDASFISGNNPSYLFRNYGSATGKSYHVMMWDHPVKKGDVTNWHALYSWFSSPIEDTFRSGGSDPKFVYQSCINGEPTEITVGADGKSDEPSAGIDNVIVDNADAFAYALEGRIVISESAPDACCYDLSGKLIHKGAGSFAVPAGIYIVNDMHGHSVKLFVK